MMEIFTSCVKDLRPAPLLRIPRSERLRFHAVDSATYLLGAIGLGSSSLLAIL